jgi:antitoxin component YwqK of YwqJK toxin-antitoxin module
VSQHNPNGSINHIREIFFDDRGNKVREILRYPNGAVGDQVSIYDADGKLIEFISRNGEGILHHKVFWSYDSHGNPIELTVEQPNGQRQQQFKKELGYDDNGNIIEELNYRADGSPKSKETFTYEFDGQRNWIKRTTLRELFTRRGSRLESEITYRRITYFE